MRTPSKIEAAGDPADTSKQQIEADSITWKRDYKGCIVTIFGSRSAGWNVKIDKREPIILGYTRPRAIKYAKELIDGEQANFTLDRRADFRATGRFPQGLHDNRFRLSFQRTDGEVKTKGRLFQGNSRVVSGPDLSFL